MKNNGIPSVEFGSCRVDVHRVPEPSIDGDLGLYQAEKGKIFVHEDMPHDTEAITVLHELIHAMVFFTGLRNDLPKKTEERICDALSMCFYDLLRRNPGFVRYLTQ